MDASVTPAGALSYAGRDVTALLDSRGGSLHWYFWVMLGDQTSVTRALAGTVIVALPDPGHRQLFEIAHAVCRQHHPTPAIPYARAEAPTLAAATRAALRRLVPADREICVLGAPAYQLNDGDLAAVLETATVEDRWSRAMDAFAVQLAACAADAGLDQDEDLVERALRLFGADQYALSYDEVVALATDPAAHWLRDGIRARVAAPARTATARHEGLEQLGIGAHLTVTIQGMENAERLTVPLPRVPRKGGHHGSHRRRTAMAGGVLVAGAIPVALAMAWAGHSGQPAAAAAVPPLSASSGSPVTAAASAPGSPARGPAIPAARPPGRHEHMDPGVPPVATSPIVATGVTGATGSAPPMAAAPTPTPTAPPTTSAPSPMPPTPTPAPPSPSPTPTHRKGKGG